MNASIIIKSKVQPVIFTPLTICGHSQDLVEQLLSSSIFHSMIAHNLWLFTICDCNCLYLWIFVNSLTSCSECEVFSKNHAAPFSKVITFHKKEPFELEAFYTHPHDVPYPDTRIGKKLP